MIRPKINAQHKKLLDIFTYFHHRLILSLRLYSFLLKINSSCQSHLTHDPLPPLRSSIYWLVFFFGLMNDMYGSGMTEIFEFDEVVFEE